MTILALFEVAYRFLFFSVFHDDVSDFKLIIQWVQGASCCSVVSGGCQWIYVIKSGAANGRWTVSQWVRNVLLSCPVFARSIFISSEGDGLETSWWRKLLVAVCLSCLCSCFSWEPFQGSSLSLLFQKMSCFVPVSCCSALSPIPNKPLYKSMVMWPSGISPASPWCPPSLWVLHKGWAESYLFSQSQTCYGLWNECLPWKSKAVPVSYRAPVALWGAPLCSWGPGALGESHSRNCLLLCQEMLCATSPTPVLLLTGRFLEHANAESWWFFTSVKVNE